MSPERTVQKGSPLNPSPHGKPRPDQHIRESEPIGTLFPITRIARARSRAYGTTAKQGSEGFKGSDLCSQTRAHGLTKNAR